MYYRSRFVLLLLLIINIGILICFQVFVAFIVIKHTNKHSFVYMNIYKILALPSNITLRSQYPTYKTRVFPRILDNKAVNNAAHSALNTSYYNIPLLFVLNASLKYFISKYIFKKKKKSNQSPH